MNERYGGNCTCNAISPLSYILFSVLKHRTRKSIIYKWSVKGFNDFDSIFAGTVYLWSMDKDTPLAELEKHPARISKIAFHQTGRYLATAWFVLFRLLEKDIHLKKKHF